MTTGAINTEVSQGGTSGGGSAVSIADGADIAQGTTTDAAVTTDIAGTLAGKLRGLVKILSDVWDSVGHRLHVAVDNVGDGANVALGVTTATHSEVTDTTSASAISLLKGLLYTLKNGSAVQTTAWNVTVVSGGLSATQSGTWSVNQSGTWTVQLGTTDSTKLSNIQNYCFATMNQTAWGETTRSTWSFRAILATGATSEAMLSMIPNVAGVDGGATNSGYQVPNGNTLRITSMQVDVLNTTTVANRVQINLRAKIGGGSLATTDPIFARAVAAANAALAAGAGSICITFPEGLMFSSAYLVGCSQICSVTTASIVSVVLTGYLY